METDAAREIRRGGGAWSRGCKSCIRAFGYICSGVYLLPRVWFMVVCLTTVCMVVVTSDSGSGSGGLSLSLTRV